MKLLDLVTSPWAMLPDKLLEMQSIYATHLRGEKIDIASVEARIGKPLKNEPQPYQVVNGVAIIAMDGVLSKRANLFSAISGGTSTDLIARDFKAAIADPGVTAIVLAIDSPGGSVDGAQQLAKLVAGARGSKPIVSYADGTMCSAAYWIGCAADSIYIADQTTVVGSIGVVATHMDVSGAEASRGVKTTEIVAGSYKRIASQYGALTESGRSALQAQVDAIYAVFVADVATSRDVSIEQCLADMADGRLFIGKAAIDAKLVDGVSTLDNLIADLSTKAAGVAAKTKVPSFNPKGNAMDISKDSIAASHPEIAEAFRAEGRVEGATAERQRILAVEAQALPGHQPLIAQLKADGKTSGPEAAAQVLAAERGRLAAAGADMTAEAPAAVPHVETPAPSPEAGKSDQAKLHSKARQHMTAHPGTSLLDAINAVSKEV
jgi:capsid assembly protease